MNTILLVEDNEDDIFAFKRMMKRSESEVPVQIATDGRMAVQYLSGEGDYSDRKAHPFPCLVFLDLKMPYMNGTEVMEWIADQSALQGLPVVVLSGSDEPRDHEKLRSLGARDYLVKPATSEQLKSAIQSYC